MIDTSSDKSLFDFCFDFADKSNSLAEGTYCSDDKRHTIIFIDRMDTILSGNLKVSMAQVNRQRFNSLSPCFKIFVLLWGLLRYKEKEDIDADRQALQIILRNNIISSKKDFLMEMRTIFTSTNPERNERRIVEIEKIFSRPALV